MDENPDDPLTLSMRIYDECMAFDPTGSYLFSYMDIASKVPKNDINLTKGFTTVRAIRQFQQANNVFTVELARRLHRAATPVTITCVQPGMVATNIRRNFTRWMRWVVTLAGPLLALPPERTAASIVTLLCDPAFEGLSGAHFSHIRRFKPARVPAAHRPEEGARLWALTEHLIAHAQQRTMPRRGVTFRPNELS